MAGLTRKFIKDAAKDAGVELPAEMIDAIIGAHVESRDAAIEAAVKPLNEQLEAAKTGGEDNGYKAKYEAEHTALETLKTEIATKETTAKKTAAVRALLAEAKISEKRHDIVVKSLLPDFDKIELDADGKIKDADKLKTTITTDWAEFIETTEKKPAATPTPPVKQTGDTKEAEVIARVRTAMGLPPETT